MPRISRALADVPPRDVLLAKLAGGFQAPLVKAAGLFQAFTRNFAYGLKALVDQRVEGGEALVVEPDAASEPETAEAPEAPTAEAPEAPAGAPAETTDSAPSEEAPAAETATTEGD